MGFFFFFQAEDGIRDVAVTGVQTCALPICKETGETALLRELFDRLQPGSVLLADRFYCSYFMVALLRERNVDVVFRLHHRRHADFRRGLRLGRNDHIVTWPRPPRPEWMDEETFARMPRQLLIREVRTR